MKPEEADYDLLKLANEKGKFAIGMGYPMNEEQSAAFERGIDEDWFSLVDIARIAHSEGQYVRVFKLTEAGRAEFSRLAESQRSQNEQ